jgi:alpha-D-xyloside xylohydrolase
MVRTRQTMVVVALLAAPIAARAVEPVVLESALLRLEVTAEPYGYRVIEKASGDILVAQTGTTFTVAAPPAGADAALPVVAGPDGGAPDAPPAAPVAVRVLAATAVSAAAGTLSAELVLEGRTEHGQVGFTFTSPQVLEVEIALPGSQRVEEQLADQQEHIYGVWEYPFGGNLDNRGTARPYLGVGNLPGSNFTSARAPFYVTSRRHGVYVRSSARGQFTLAVAGKTGFAFDEPSLRYDVIYGPGVYDVLARYTALAGGPLMPPLWAQGAIWWSDDFHRDLGRTANAQENVVDLATQLRALHIPASGVLIDRPYGTGTQGWGNMDFDASFPDPPAMARALHDRGMELILWVANRAWNGLYTDGAAGGWLFPSVPAARGPAVDLRIPGARDWLLGRLGILPALGAKGYKIDRGEEGEQPDAVQNDNVTRFAEVARDSLAAPHGDQAFIFTRNVHDTGRRFTAVWSGDAASTFAGLTTSIAAGVRSGAIVMPMWGSDTGGYGRSGGGPSEELFARWFGFSAWSPMMEILVGGGHTPWYGGSPALVAIARKHTTTHHDLIPYTRSFLYAATRTGAPVVRALAFEYPDDERLANRADQYLYGSELLVAPVITEGATTRDVILPAGRWLEYEDRREVWSGPATVTVRAPLGVIPVFVREGGIVPRGNILRANDDWTPSWAPALRIELFPAATPMLRRFDYFTGSGVAAITAESAPGKVTVTTLDLGLPAKLDIHLAAAGQVSRNGVPLAAGVDYQRDPERRLVTVPVTGASTVTVEDAVSVFAPALAADGGMVATPVPASGCGCRTAGPGRAPLLAAVPLLLLALRRRRRR